MNARKASAAMAPAERSTSKRLGIFVEVTGSQTLVVRWPSSEADQSRRSSVRLGRLLVEERDDHGRERVSTEDRVVSEPRENGELRGWSPGSIPPTVPLSTA